MAKKPPPFVKKGKDKDKDDDKKNGGFHAKTAHHASGHKGRGKK